VSDLLIFNALIEFFEEDDWDFQWMAQTSTLSLDFHGRNGHWRCYAQAIDANSQFMFYSVAPVRVPQQRRQRMAEFVTRVNYGLLGGCLEMNFDDGKVRLRTGIDVEGAELVPALIRQVVYGNLIQFDYYLPGLMAVMYADTPPEQILREIIGPDLPDDTNSDDDETPPDPIS